MNIFDYLRNRLLLKAGLITPEKPVSGVTLDDLYKSEWDSEFERLMRNRLVMGALRYGKMRVPGKPQYDRVPSMIKRLNLYHATGNKEFLVDVANLCLLEFVECHHPNAHFCADDVAEKVQVKSK